MYALDTGFFMDWQARHYPLDLALAKLKGGIVVSQETSVQEKHRPRRSYFIPDVCRDLGLPCVNLLGMMRREKWTF